MGKFYSKTRLGGPGSFLLLGDAMSQVQWLPAEGEIDGGKGHTHYFCSHSMAITQDFGVLSRSVGGGGVGSVIRFISFKVELPRTQVLLVRILTLIRITCRLWGICSLGSWTSSLSLTLKVTGDPDLAKENLDDSYVHERLRNTGLGHSIGTPLREHSSLLWPSNLKKL